MTMKPSLRLKKVTLYENTEEGFDEVTFLVRRVQLHQFPRLMVQVYNIYNTVQSNEKLMNLFKQIFQDEEAIEEDVLQNFTPEELREIRAEKRKKSEAQFLTGLLGSFEVLLVHLPNEAIDLMEVMVNIDEDLLGQQDYEGVADLYQAFLDVNDLEAMIERGKKLWEGSKEYVEKIVKDRNQEQSKAALKRQLQ